MNKKYLLGGGLVAAVIIVIFLISPVRAAIIDTIFSGTTESDAINITFSSAGSNDSIFFEISRFVTIRNASINISGLNLQGGYTGFSFATGSSGSWGITHNASYFHTTDFDDDEVYEYWRNGTLTGNSFDTLSCGNGVPLGITNNDTYFWIVDSGGLRVYEYLRNGTCTINPFDVSVSGSAVPQGIDHNDTHFFITDYVDAEVYIFFMNGTYTSTSFDTAACGNTAPQGIDNDGTTFHIINDDDDRAYEFLMDGTCTGNSFATVGTQSQGITKNSTTAWIVDDADDTVYEYSLISYPANVSIDIEIDGDNEFYLDGSLNSTNSPQQFNYTNFTTSLQHYINITCVTDSCNVTMNISTDRAGVIQLDTISIGTTPSRLGVEYYPSGNVLETHYANFNTTVFFETGENPAVFLWYNGTYHSATQIEKNDNNATYRVLFSLPLVTNTYNESKLFHWNITDSEINYNTENNNHTVYRINLTSCMAPAITNTLNFTIFDEIDGVPVSSDLDSVWTFWANTGDGSVTREYSNGTDGQTFFNFCLFPSWANLTTNAIISYSAVGYEPRDYHLVDYNLDNSSENISLYLLSTANATTFKLTVRDNSYFYYPNHVVRTLRYRAATDSFIEVESCTTDVDATCLTHLVLEDVDYRFMVVDPDGIIVHTTGNIRPYCPESAIFSQCLLTVLIPPPLETYSYVWDEITGLSYSLTFNNVTNVSSLTYSFLAGSVTYIRFKVTQGLTTICSTNASAVAGVITCDLNGYNGTVKQQVFLARSDELAFLTKYLDLGQIFQGFGDAGLFFLILIVITIAISSVVTGSPIAAIVLSIAALGIGLVTGIGNMGVAAVIMLAVAGAFVIYKLRQ